MFIVHASAGGGALLLWGETAPAAPVVRRGRKTVSPSPTNAGAARVANALAEVVPQVAPRDSAIETCILWLPSVKNQPILSSPLLGPPLESKTPPLLAPWSITALRLSAEQAVDLLCACVGRDTLGPGVAIGSSLAYWVHVLRFAGALIAREQFLPSLRTDGENYRACWQPVLSGADGQRLHQLAGIMPPACRALGTADAPPDRPALAVATEVVENLVDVLVRTSAPSSAALAKPTPAFRVRRAAKKSPAFASVHDAWLHALRSADGRIHGDGAAARQLAEQARSWQRPVLLTTAAPFRLCFRLEEPPDSDEDDAGIAASSDWYVRYLLQGREDPSLLLPVADAWNPKGRIAAVFRKSSFDSREYLLTALGQAASICAEVEASLKSAAPGGYSTDARGAHAFLTETAWLLEQAGFGVLLPSWWMRGGTRQRLSVRANVKTPAMSGGSGMTLEEIVHFDWQAALGDQPLSLRELETLAQLKTPLVRVRGQWVHVSAEEIQAALDFWKKKRESQTTVRELVRMALGGDGGPAGLEVSGVHAEGWIGELLGQLEGQAAFAELSAPSGFHGTLRPYQTRGYSWLAFLRRWRLGACLADDMGLGKTIQTLVLLEREREAGERRPALLVCPTSVVGNWKKEAERFTPELPVLVHHGAERVKGASFAKKAEKHALVLSSYALLHRDRETLEKVNWSGVILDEAQNVKNPETKQSQAARALPADYRIALTGTPVENHVGDLWSIVEFLNPGLLGTRADFRRRFFVPIQANRDAEAAGRLKRLTGPFLLRRLKTDKSIIADLPDKLEMKVFCNLTREQASLYAAVVEETSRAIEESEGIQRKGLILGTLMKLKQVCNHPAHFLGDNSLLPGRSGKLARLTEMLEEILDAGDRALIFTQFTDMGDLLQHHLQETFGREVLYLHGGVPAKQRNRLVERFQNDPQGPRLFLLSLKAGGTGLNLTAAQHVFHFDRWWNPAVENQATDRAFRIGQTRNVQVHKFLCVGTLEEKIDEMIERKQEVASRVVGAGEGWLTELSNDQLKDLFALRQEAIGD
jgi:SNF2 family DNA or RNA helicase